MENPFESEEKMLIWLYECTIAASRRTPEEYEEIVAPLRKAAAEGNKFYTLLMQILDKNVALMRKAAS